MKRISTLFSLLLLMLGVMTVYAQTPDASAITSEVVPSGYYFIASSAESAYSITSPYLAANNNSMKLVAKTDVTTNVSTSTVGLWYIKKTGTDGSDSHPIYSIQSMEGSKLYWSVGGDCPLGSTVGIYRIGKDDAGNYYFYGNGTANNVTSTARVNATSATSFNRNNDGSNTTWKLIPAGVKDITLVYNNEKRSFTQSKSMVAVGSEVSTNLNLDFYDSFNPSSVTVTDNDDSYTISCKTSFPFEEDKFYMVKLRWAGRNWNGDNEKDDKDVYTNRSLVWDGVLKSQISTRANVTESNNGLWCLKFVEGTPNQVYLCSALNTEHARVYMDNTNNHTKAYIKVVGTPFICKKGNTSANYSNGFRLQALSNENANLNDDDGKLGYWTDGGSKTNDGSTFTVYEPTSSPELVSVNTVVATNSATNEQITFAGEPFVVTGMGNDKFATNNFISVSNIKYDKGTQTLSLDYTSTAPYLLSGDKDTEKHWQVLRSRKDGRNDCYLKANENSIQSRGNSLNRSSFSDLRNFNATDANQWAIIPAAGFDKFYLVNKATAGKAYLASETQGTELVISTEHATPLYLNAQPALDGITGGFTIQPNASNNHAIGDHLSGNLGYWSNRSGDTELHDEGSIFRVADLLADSKAFVNATPTDYVGSVSESARGTLNAITGASEQSKVSAFFTKYDELAATSDLYTAPANDKIYRIRVNRYSGNIYACFAKATADSEGNVKQGSGNTPTERLLGFTDTESAMTYVRFIKQDGGYYLIQDVNSNFYYGSRAEDNKLYAVFNPEHAGHYTIENSINGTLTCVALKENKATDITKQYLWCSGDNESGALGQYNYFSFHSPYKSNATTGSLSDVEPGCVYRVQAVSTYPVTFKAEYSTLNLPFDVTLPENVEAYVVSSVLENTVGEHRELAITKVEGTVHANTPVILRCTNSTKPTSEEPVSVNLGVTGAATQAEGVNNILSGSTVRRTEFGEVSYYALANKALTEGGEKQIGFFRVSTQTMPANKAYLLRSRIPASAENAMALLFNFDGDHITSIGNAAQTKAQGSEVYYDLNGRRVLYPTHGIYVKGNGQKVFIK